LNAAVEPIDDAGTCELDQRDLLLIARLEPDGRPGGYIQMHAVRGGTVEIERRVDLEEVEMASDLHRPVAGVADRDTRGAPALAGRFQDLGRQDRDRLRIVEQTAARPALSRQLRSHVDQELLLLARSEMHPCSFPFLTTLVRQYSSVFSPAAMMKSLLLYGTRMNTDRLGSCSSAGSVGFRVPYLFFDHNATGCINSQKRGHELREFLSSNS